VTQLERVIKASKSYRGITQVDFLGSHTIDEGKPITRLAARIQDARDQGHVFESLGTRDGCKVYRWVSGPALEETPARPDPSTLREPEHSASPVALAGATPPEPDPLFPVEPSTAHWKAA
jgi:hypothetical protein